MTTMRCTRFNFHRQPFKCVAFLLQNIGYFTKTQIFLIFFFESDSLFQSNQWWRCFTLHNLVVVHSLFFFLQISSAKTNNKNSRSATNSGYTQHDSQQVNNQTVKWVTLAPRKRQPCATETTIVGAKFRWLKLIFFKYSIRSDKDILLSISFYL